MAVILRSLISYAALALIVVASLTASADPAMKFLGTAGPVAVTGSTLIIGNGTSIKALNLSEGGQVMWEKSLNFIPDSITISPNREYVVACSDEGGAAMLFVGNGSEVADVRGTCPAVFSPDSAWLALKTPGGLWVYSVRGAEKEYYSIGTPVSLAWMRDTLLVIGLSGGNGTAYIIRPLEDAERVGPASGIAGLINRDEAVVYSSRGLYFIGPDGMRGWVGLDKVFMAKALSNGFIAASLVNGSIVLVNESGIAWIAMVFPGNRTYPVIEYATVVQGHVVMEARSSIVPEWAVIVVNPETGETPIMEVTNDTELHAYPSEDGYLLITEGRRESVLYRLTSEEVREIARIEAGGRGLWCGTHLIISEPRPKLVTIDGDRASTADIPVKGEPIRWFPGCSLLLTSEPLTSTAFMLRVYDTSTWEEIDDAKVSLREVLVGGDALIKEVAKNTYLIIFPHMRMGAIPEHSLLLANESAAEMYGATQPLWNANPYTTLAAVIASIITILLVYKMKHKK